MEITAAGNNVLRGTAQAILLTVVRDTDDALKTVKFMFSSSAAAKKGVKTIIFHRT